MVTGPLVVKLTLVKLHHRLDVHPGENIQPMFRVTKAGVFKINGDDDDYIFYRVVPKDEF